VADFVFNIAKGKVKYYSELSAANDALVYVLVLASGLETDATLKDYTTLSALLAGTTDECTFTNYARKTVTSATITVDNTNDRVDIDIADQTWTSAGGATNNSIGALIICYDDDTTSGTDANLIPLTKHDFTATTDGTDLTAVIAASGYYRAA